MKDAGRKIKRLSIALLVSLIVIIGGLLYFFIANDAPAIFGKVIFNQEYKENLTLDIYLPTQLVFEKTPVVIFIHGGAWVGGGKGVVNINRFNESINQLRQKGYAVISTNYTLGRRNKSPFPECILDAIETVNWVVENANHYNFDIDNVGLFGASAGAHIAMMTAYAQPKDIADTAELKTKIDYVVDLYGPTDLDKLYHMQTVENINTHIEKLPENLRKHLDIAQQLFGFDPEKDSLKAQSFINKYSPVNYVHKDIPPTLIIHGTADQIVSFEQSVELHKLLDSLQVDCQFYPLSDINHAFRGATKSQKKEIQNLIVAFIEKQYNTNNN